MGVQYTRNNGRPVGGDPYRQMAKELQGIYEDEMEFAGDQAYDKMHQLFDQAGTGRTWQAPRGGRTTGDRKDTGFMERDLKVRLTRGKNIGLDVGWVNNFEDYYDLQNEGFFHARGGFTVRAMNLIGAETTLGYFVRDKVNEALDRAGKRVVDGL